MFLKNHKKIENGFRDLLLQCFEDKEEANLDSNQKDKENKNDEGYLYKTQSNKKNPDIMNCVNIENEYYSESNIYIVSLGNYEFPSNFYDIVPHGYDIIREIKKWMRKRSNFAAYIRNTNRDIKSATDISSCASMQ